jgi:hypothetical protein
MAVPHKVGNVTAGLMIASALLIDGIQGLLVISVLLLPLGWFLSILGLILFFIWFALCGVNYSAGGGKKLLTMLATALVEFAPVINGLPATTAGVIGIIVQTRIEEARAAAGGKVTPNTAMAYARLQKMKAARANRESSAREGREEAQQARHAPSKDSVAP